MRADRRAFLAGAAAAPFALRFLPAGAAAPGTQVLGIQHAPAGDGVLTAVLDGHLEIAPELFSNLSPEEAEAFLADAFRAPGPVPTGINCFLWRDAERTVLIDVGGLGAFPGTGHLFDALTELEVAPEEVDAVLITHIHPDHIGGLVRDGAATFPNAALHVSEADLAFWTSEEVMGHASPDFQPFFQFAMAATSAYGERLTPFTGAVELLPGISTVPMPGHTVGHTGFMLDGEAPLLVWGDVVHVAAFQFAKPSATIGFDTDQALAAETRAKVFDMASTDRLRIAGMHLAFPGIGHVAKAGEGYRYEASDWAFSLD